MLLGVMLSLMGSAQADEISAEVLMQASPTEGLVTGAGARFQSDGAFLSMEGRGAAEGAWIGRATGGLDLFGGSDRVDLTVGLFLGTTGDWGDPSIQMAGTAGAELGLGLHVGPLHARYRHADGFRGPLEDRLTENELRLGYRMFDTVEVFGQYMRFNPGEAAPIEGYGAGAKIVF